ncbi:unnamed protein product [Litomosoides sigmodontis]|uniref:Uncharacterized protein n=1 Tax=Litomosoides sigmodontis TaxID=42156 RepID=A0A3P6UDX7_LITSI|nr:unnamed protein product [Litomosoides sigmodontis]
MGFAVRFTFIAMLLVLRNSETNAQGQKLMSGVSGSVTYNPLQGTQCHATRDWLIGIGALVGFTLFGFYAGTRLSKKEIRVNNKIKLSTNKVAETVDVEDIGQQKAFCRCWKSNNVGFAACLL